MTETKISSEVIHTGRVLSYTIDTVRLSDGSPSIREVVWHNGGVVIVPYLPNAYVLVEQYRYAIGQSLLEFPAGKLNKGENPDTCAARELKEETGYTAKHIIKLGHIYPAPGFCSERLHLYLAYGLEAGEQSLDEDEILCAKHFGHDEILSLINNAKIHDAKTISAWTLAQAYITANNINPQ